MHPRNEDQCVYDRWFVAAGRSREEILKAYPNLEEEDIREALQYAAWRVEELEVPLAPVGSF